MKQSRKTSRSLQCLAVGLLFAGVAIATDATPAAAQSSRANAEQLCTPDVMRLCDRYIPDPNRIVRCLKAKRKQLSPGCRSVMSGGKAKKRKRTAGT